GEREWRRAAGAVGRGHVIDGDIGTVVVKNRGRPRTLDAERGIHRVAEVDEEGAVVLRRGVGDDRDRDRSTQRAGRNDNGAIRRYVIGAGLAGAVGGRVANRRVQAADGRQRYREGGVGLAAVSFPNGHIVDGGARRQVIVENRARAQGAGDGGVDRAAQLSQEGLAP